MKNIRIDMTFITECPDDQEIHIMDIEKALEAAGFDAVRMDALSTPTYMLRVKERSEEPKPEACPNHMELLEWTYSYATEHGRACPHDHCLTKSGRRF